MRLSGVAALAIVFSIAFVTAASADCPKTGRYSVKIDSAPPGAPIYIGDKTCQVGVTPWEGKLNKATYTVIIETPGYETATKQFVVAALRKQQELFVPLVKKADPPKLDIRADADPKGMAGAIVLLDGEVKGQAPLVITTTAGRHQHRITKDGYEAFENWYTTTDNNTQTVMPSRKEISKPKYGVVVVDSDVPDGEVYIDGNKNPDNTPTVIQNVIEGLHVVEVRKAPALPRKQTLQVTAGQQTKVRAELHATLTGGDGDVRVLSDAQGARAFIDGTDMGPVPVDIKDVKAGEHIVQVKAPGMQAGEKKVAVAAGSSQIVKFDLNAEAAGDSGILKIVSMVPEAQVFIDGAAVGKVPQEKHVSAGEHPVVVRLDGFKQFEQKVRVEAGQTVTVQATLQPVGRLRVLATPSPSDVIISGIPVGKTQTLSRELMIAGPSEAELVAEQRGLSSFGARTLPRGRSTVDFSIGYPYYLDGRVNGGAGRIAHKCGFDAGVAVRTMLARTEIGIGGRAMLADNEPFSFGVFSNIYWGSKLLDNSARNGLTWDAGILASLTALTLVTITGRLYLDVWSDRHCPDKKTMGMTSPSDVFDGDAIGACKFFYANASNTTNPDVMRITKLTGWTQPDDVFGRENGVRLMASIVAGRAGGRDGGAGGILEGAPFQGERAFFTNEFAHSMFDTDFNLYVKLGLSYKF